MKNLDEEMCEILFSCIEKNDCCAMVGQPLQDSGLSYH